MSFPSRATEAPYPGGSALCGTHSKGMAVLHYFCLIFLSNLHSCTIGLLFDWFFKLQQLETSYLPVCMNPRVLGPLPILLVYL